MKENQISLCVDREYECDVLVAGGGVSGFAAAVSAARCGAKTILIESGGFLGGTATKGFVGPFMTCYDAKGETQIIRGLFSELVERLERVGGCVPYTACRGGDSFSGYRTAGHIGVTPFDGEALKRVTEEMCLEAGVRLLYHTAVIGCATETNRVTHVYAADAGNILSIQAHTFIDTTGSAVLAARAGAETMRGNDDGILQTASTFFKITGVDKAALDAYMAEHTDMRSRFFMDVIAAGQADGSFPCGTQKLRIFENPDGETWTVNMAQVDDQLNELDGESVTDAEIMQRQQILQIVAFLKKHIAPLRNIRLLSTASDIGVRESRRIVGRTVMTREDILNARKFDDAIAVCANSIDIHQKKGVSYSAHTEESYTIPLSSLISVNIENLLTAGKSLSADRYAFAAVRVMPPCVAMGQAAGITAALAAKKRIAVRDVPYAEVKEHLLCGGAYLGE